MNLIEFLNERLTEDEAAACYFEHMRSWRQATTEDHAYKTSPQDVVAQRRDGTAVRIVATGHGAMGPDFARHIARYDPARVLAEADVKHGVLRALEVAIERGRDTKDLIHAVRLMAKVYSDHPDYQQEWRP